MNFVDLLDLTDLGHLVSNPVKISDIRRSQSPHLVRVLPAEAISHVTNCRRRLHLHLCLHINPYHPRGQVGHPAGCIPPRKQLGLPVPLAAAAPPALPQSHQSQHPPPPLCTSSRAASQ